MIEASRFSQARTAPPGRFAIHGIDLVVEGDVRAAVDAVAMSYAAFSTSEVVRAGAEHPVRIGAWHEGEHYRLIDHRGRPTIVRGETDAVLGLLDRVVDTVLDHLATRGIIGTHAGVVEVRERAILLSGRSGRGKSTLTLGLIRRGAGWLTDELALVAPDDHTMLPYPRALHVSPGTVDLLPELSFLHMRPRYELGGESEWSVTPADIEAAFGARRAGPTPLALIVLLDGDPDPSREPEIRPISPALAAMELLRGTPASALDFEGTMRRLSAIAERVPTVRLRVGELDRTALAVRDWMAALP